MTAALLHAAAALADTLAHENAALARLDLLAATALLPEKRQATENFAAAHARLAANPSSARREPIAIAAQHLRDLAAENRRLLDRAMAIQARVLEIIAEAAQRASLQAPRYGAAGVLVGANRALPVAIASSI